MSYFRDGVSYCDHGHPLIGDNLKLRGTRKQHRCNECDKKRSREGYHRRRYRVAYFAPTSDEALRRYLSLVLPNRSTAAKPVETAVHDILELRNTYQASADAVADPAAKVGLLLALSALDRAIRLLGDALIELHRQEDLQQTVKDLESVDGIKRPGSGASGEPLVFTVGSEPWKRRYKSQTDQTDSNDIVIPQGTKK